MPGPPTSPSWICATTAWWETAPGCKPATSPAGKKSSLAPVPPLVLPMSARGLFLPGPEPPALRSEEHTSELQSLRHLVCRLLLEKKLSFVFVVAGGAERGVNDRAKGALCVLELPVNLRVNLFFFLGCGAPRIPPLFPAPALFG